MSRHSYGASLTRTSGLAVVRLRQGLLYNSQQMRKKSGCGPRNPRLTAAFIFVLTDIFCEALISLRGNIAKCFASPPS